MRQNQLFQIDVLLSPNEDMHTHPSGELVMVLEGSLQIETDSILEVKEGDIFYINGGDRHAKRSMTEDALVFRCYFSTKLLKSGDYYVCNSQGKMEAKYFQEMRETIHELLVDYYAGDDKEGFLRLSLCYRLIHLLKTYFKVNLQQTRQEDRIKILCAYMEQNYIEDLTLQSMAETFNFSSAYLSRLFKEKIGENIIPYLNRIRMRHAVEDLISTKDTVTQLAMNNGFASTTAFYSNFSRAFGMKPLEYRKRFQKTVSKTSPDIYKEVKHRLGEHLSYYRFEKAKEAGEMITVSASMERGKPVAQVFTKMVNLGDASLFQSSAVLQQVQKVRTELGCRYIRFWNVFPPEVYEGKPWKDYSKLEEILSFFQDGSLVPYIQIGSERMSDNELAKYGDAKVRTFRTAQDLISACKSLFDYISKVLSFDVPLIFELRCGLVEREGEPQPGNYFEIFRKVKELLRMRLPEATLGGSGLPLHPSLERNVLSHWVKAGIRPDFFAFSSFPYRSVGVGTKYLPDTDFIKKYLAQIQNSMRKHFGEFIPIFITEWNAFLSTRNYFQDSLWKGCYTAKMYADTLGEVTLIGHSRLFDEKEGDVSDSALLCGGSGMLTRSGIPKPSYGVARSLRSMGSVELAKKEGCVITSRGKDTVRILLYNYKHFNYKFYQKEEHEIALRDMKQYLENMEPQTFRIEIDGLENGKYYIRQYSISEERGSVQDEWIRKNCEKFIQEDRMLFLNYSSQPDVRISSVEVKCGMLSQEFTLEPLEIVSVSIMKAMI